MALSFFILDYNYLPISYGSVAIDFKFIEKMTFFMYFIAFSLGV